MLSSRCANCLYWDNRHESLVDVLKVWGYCRKHYPVVYAKDGRYYGTWPLTDSDGFCGEFRSDKEQ